MPKISPLENLLPFNSQDIPSAQNNVGARAHTPKLELVTYSPPQTDRHNNPNKTRLNIWPETDLLVKVKQHCYLTQTTLTAFFEAAASDYLQHQEHQIENVCARAHTSIKEIDDLRNKDIASSFLFRFWVEAYNATMWPLFGPQKVTWTKDDAAQADRFSDVDPRIIELGILQTIAQKPDHTGPIKTFKYFRNEIKKWMHARTIGGEQMIAAAHISNVKRARKHFGLPPHDYSSPWPPIDQEKPK